MAIPGTPFYAPFAFLDVYRVADSLSHVVQFLNFFRCCHNAHLLQLFNEKSAEMRDRQMRMMGKAQLTQKNHRIAAAPSFPRPPDELVMNSALPPVLLEK